MTTLSSVIRSDQPYIILDSETTSLDALAEVTSIACLHSSGKTLFDQYLRPSRKISARASEVSGITNAMVRKCPTFEQILPELYELLYGQIIIGWNVDFDRKMLYRSTKAWNLPLVHWGSDMIWIDAMKPFSYEIWKQFNGFRNDWQWSSLSNACEFYQIKVRRSSAPHTALGDTRLTRKVLLKMKEDYRLE